MGYRYMMYPMNCFATHVSALFVVVWATQAQAQSYPPVPPPAQYLPPSPYPPNPAQYLPPSPYPTSASCSLFINCAPPLAVPSPPAPVTQWTPLIEVINAAVRAYYNISSTGTLNTTSAQLQLAIIKAAACTAGVPKSGLVDAIRAFIYSPSGTTNFMSCLFNNCLQQQSSGYQYYSSSGYYSPTFTIMDPSSDYPGQEYPLEATALRWASELAPDLVNAFCLPVTSFGAADPAFTGFVSSLINAQPSARSLFDGAIGALTALFSRTDGICAPGVSWSQPYASCLCSVNVPRLLEAISCSSRGVQCTCTPPGGSYSAPRNFYCTDHTSATALARIAASAIFNSTIGVCAAASGDTSCLHKVRAPCCARRPNPARALCAPTPCPPHALVRPFCGPSCGPSPMPSMPSSHRGTRMRVPAWCAHSS